MDSSARKKVITTLAVLLVITVIVVGVAMANKKDKPAASTATTTSQPSNDTSADTSSSTATTASYKDGTYSATGGFNTPGGPDTITITVSIKDGEVTSTSAVKHSPDSESAEYDQQFVDAYQQQVEGKKLASLHLSRVAGASLTSIGFNNAIEQIKSNAQA